MFRSVLRPLSFQGIWPVCYSVIFEDAVSSWDYIASIWWGGLNDKSKEMWGKPSWPFLRYYLETDL